MPVIVNSGIGDCDEVILKERVGVVVNDFSLREYERAVGELKSLMFEGNALRMRCIQAAEKFFSLEMGIRKYYDIYGRLLGRK